MNMHATQPVAVVLTTDSVQQALIEIMRQLQPSAIRTEEECLTALAAHYASHALVSGTFTIKPTLWGFPELTFSGTVLGQNLTVSIWCY